MVEFLKCDLDLQFPEKYCTITSSFLSPPRLTTKNLGFKRDAIIGKQKTPKNTLHMQYLHSVRRAWILCFLRVSNFNAERMVHMCCLKYYALLFATSYQLQAAYEFEIENLHFLSNSQIDPHLDFFIRLELVAFQVKRRRSKKDTSGN